VLAGLALFYVGAVLCLNGLWESISKRGAMRPSCEFPTPVLLHSRIPANEGLPELVIEHLRSDLQ
jgi:hypothetical protein